MLQNANHQNLKIWDHKLLIKPPLFNKLEYQALYKPRFLDQTFWTLKTWTLEVKSISME